jgi:two-component sensor histidine kinase
VALGWHRKQSGAVFPVELSGNNFEVHGQKLLVMAIRDITERKQAEETMRLALAEKTVLLKEVHHRVKNNLQIVISLLNLQSKEACPDAVRDILATTQNRVRSMALIHENLYQSESLACLNLTHYLEGLCTHLLRGAGPVNARVAIESQVENERISIELNQAVPCGLLINELVTNALKHAFPGERPGLIRVTLQRPSPQEVRLTVADDGVGLPAALDPHHSTSLGLRLVCLLTEQLHGTVTFERGQGTAVQILFPNSAETNTPHE